MINYVQEFIDKFEMKLNIEDPLAKQKFIDNAEIFIREEFNELIDAVSTGDIEEIVDALGDISWLVDKGMLMAGIDPVEVRAEIGRANLSKEIGVKPGREHAIKDVIKPLGWKGPNHEGNYGRLKEIFAEN